MNDETFVIKLTQDEYLKLLSMLQHEKAYYLNVVKTHSNNRKYCMEQLLKVIVLIEKFEEAQ